MGPLIRGFFLINTMVLHYPQFVESMNVEPGIQRNLEYVRQTLTSYMDSAAPEPYHVIKAQLYMHICTYTCVSLSLSNLLEPSYSICPMKLSYENDWTNT